MGKNFLVITSIFDPTESVKKFALTQDWQLIVVGDKKTPANWQHEGVIYLGPEDQEKLGFAILKHLPWNHYCRKMVGYLYAMQQGAERIADSDDDNEPYDTWPALPDTTAPQATLSGERFVNIYKHFTDKFVWPRGYPLNLILDTKQPTETQSTSNVAIWQFLADEDPDVDAIYRLTNDTQIIFDTSAPKVLDKGTVCPFNSQNTVFDKSVFPLLYLPAFVTFRFTDILRGLVAQPLLWKHDYRLGFGPATALQKRNPHNYMRDFELEIPVFLHSERVVGIVSAAMEQSDASTLNQQLLGAYQALRAENIVTDDEVQLLEAWNQDLQAIAG